MISGPGRCVGPALTSERSLLLEHLIAVLFPKLHSVVLAFALELIAVVAPAKIERVLDPLLSMIHMLLLFLVSLALMAPTQLETTCSRLWLGSFGLGRPKRLLCTKLLAFHQS